MAANLGEVVSTTLQNYIKKLGDNVTTNNALLVMLKEEGQIVKTPGGRQLWESVLYGTNPSVQFYQDYDVFTPPTSSNVIDVATFDWKQLGGFVSVSGREAAINQNEWEILDFAETRMKHLQAQLNNVIGASLFANGTGSGGKELGGLQLIVADNPAAAGTVGGIDQVANPFWRNQFSAAAATTTVNIGQRMDDMWLSIVRGKDKPDLVVADNSLYSLYWQSLQAQQRFTDTKLGALGFQSVKFNSADVTYDINCPVKHMYFLDLSAIKLRVHDERMFATGKTRTIQNADYEVTPVFFMGNITTNRRAAHGVVIAS